MALISINSHNALENHHQMIDTAENVNNDTVAIAPVPTPLHQLARGAR